MYCKMERRAESNTISVEIERFWQDSEEVTLEKGATIGDALVKAGLPRDTEVRIDGETYDAEDLVEDGDVLTVSTKKYAQG